MSFDTWKLFQYFLQCANKLVTLIESCTNKVSSPKEHCQVNDYAIKVPWSKWVYSQSEFWHIAHTISLTICLKMFFFRDFVIYLMKTEKSNLKGKNSSMQIESEWKVRNEIEWGKTHRKMQCLNKRELDITGQFEGLNCANIDVNGRLFFMKLKDNQIAF